MKSRILVLFFLPILLLSCSGENLYEFEELSERREFLVEVIAAPVNESEPMLCWVSFFETNGYGEIFTDSRATGQVAPLQVFNNAVKTYKEVGVNVVPGENVKEFRVRIYDLESGIEYFAQAFKYPKEEVIVTFDFEDYEASVE